MAQFTPMVLDFALSAAKAKKSNQAAKSQMEYKNSRAVRAQALKKKKLKNRLKRAQSTQRANFGAMGINGSGGSAEAVINGLGKRTDDELIITEQETEDQINKNKYVYENKKTNNLLALSAPYERMVYGKVKSILPSNNLLD